MYHFVKATGKNAVFFFVFFFLSWCLNINVTPQLDWNFHPAPGSSWVSPCGPCGLMIKPVTFLQPNFPPVKLNAPWEFQRVQVQLIDAKMLRRIRRYQTCLRYSKWGKCMEKQLSFNSSSGKTAIFHGNTTGNWGLFKKHQIYPNIISKSMRSWNPSKLQDFPGRSSHFLKKQHHHHPPPFKAKQKNRF